ncbi:MAG TPA: ATP-binding protein, partial [Cytophagaceae bacterium]|nr:ATP-binding protein [Cytophagaceae bacterium]
LFLISTLLLVGSIVYALIQTQQLKNCLNWVNQTYQMTIDLESLVLNISESESLELRYLLTENDIFLSDYNKATTLVDENLNKIKTQLFDNPLLDNPSQNKNINQLILLTTGKVDYQNETINLKRTKKLSDQLLVSRYNAGRLYLERIKFIKGLIESDLQLLLNQRQKATNNKVRDTLYGILLCFIATFIVGISLFRFIRRYIKAEQKLKSDLEDLNKNKNRFFSIISHDLRGPVNNILTLSDLIQKETSEEEKNKLNVMIDVSIKKVNGLLTNLLKWASIQMNTIEIIPQLLSATTLVDENFVILSEMARNKKIDLINEVKPDKTIWADREMTNTVLRNLISNAIKFTKTGGQITIFAAEREHTTEIFVKDNGIGISKEVMNNLFKKDIKKSTIGTANEVGSGLGLLICKEFVEKNGGSISVESEINKGTIFKISLPAKQKK